MRDADVRRIREDLDAMQQAAGLALTFRWADVWQALALAPAGALLAAWAYFGPGEYLVFGLLPLLLLALIAGARQLAKAEPTSRREMRFGTVSTLAVCAGLAVYSLWARRFGLVQGPPGAVACFFLGIMCLLLALSAPARRIYLAGTVSLMPFGLAMPLCANQQAVAAVGGLAVVLAGLTAATILAWQMRTTQRHHEPTAD
jgi:hypothetical protein